MDYIGRWLGLKFLSKESAKKYHNSDLVDRAYNEGTMSGKGVMPNIRSVITLSEPELKIKESDVEEKLIKVLEKTKVKPAKKAIAVGAEVHTTPQAFQNDDAPMCHNCGSVMVRNGSCYKCLDCGETSGCS